MPTRSAPPPATRLSCSAPGTPQGQSRCFLGFKEGGERAEAPPFRDLGRRLSASESGSPGRAVSRARGRISQSGFLGKPGRGGQQPPTPRRPREAGGGKVPPGGAGPAASVQGAERSPRAGGLQRALSLRAARSALPSPCPVLLRPHRSPLPPPLLPRAPCARQHRLDRPRGPAPPCLSGLRRAPSPSGHLRAPPPPGSPPPSPYLLLSVTGAVPPLPVGFLLLLLLLEGLRLDVFDFLQLFGRLSHGGSRRSRPRLLDP